MTDRFAVSKRSDPLEFWDARVAGADPLPAPPAALKYPIELCIAGRVRRVVHLEEIDLEELTATDLEAVREAVRESLHRACREFWAELIKFGELLAKERGSSC